jgi:hypothetical protein
LKEVSLKEDRWPSCLKVLCFVCLLWLSPKRLAAANVSPLQIPRSFSY